MAAIIGLAACGSHHTTAKNTPLTLTTIKQRLTAAGFKVSSTPPDKPATGALVVNLGGSATFYIAQYPSASQAIASVPRGDTAGVKSGHGLVEISGTFVYLLGVSGHITPAQRASFKKAYGVAERSN